MLPGDLVLTTPHLQPPLPPGEWPEQGAWTVADWERLPNDGSRYEVIDGVLFVTSAPSPLHQYTSDSLVHQLRIYLGHQHPPLGLLLSATGVILPTGPTIPDLVFVRMDNIHIVRPKRIVGVPALVVEIASPGTAGYDRREKQDAYALSGVPEYWWIDPGNRSVEVLVLEESGKYQAQGLFVGEAAIQSSLLPGLEFPVDALFLPPELVAAMRSE